MRKFFEEIFENMDIIDKAVLVILSLPLILPIIITIFSGQYLPEVGFMLRKNPWIIGYIIGRIMGIIIIFIIYMTLRFHINKKFNKK